MPQNFPEIWLGRIIQNLDKSDEGTFLNGVDEIAADVTQINAGSQSELNKIYVPNTEFEVDVLINNNTYPIPVQEYADGTIEITLDKFQTKVTTLNDDDVIGASYDKIDVVQKSHTRSILSNRYKKAIHAIAPAQNTATAPVFLATGGVDGLTDSTGRFRLTYDDLVSFKQKWEDAGNDGGVLVLNNAHWNDLLMDRKNFGDQLVNYKAGTPSPVILGFEIRTYAKMPRYSATNVKKAYGSINETTDKVASVAFMKEGIAKKTGLTKQYYVDSKSNPTGQANQLAYRHYFVVVPYQNRKIGAIL